MTIDWLDLTCPCCGGVTLVSIRQLASAPGDLACECCGGSFGGRPSGGAAAQPDNGKTAARGPQAGPPQPA